MCVKTYDPLISTELIMELSEPNHKMSRRRVLLPSRQQPSGSRPHESFVEFPEFRPQAGQWVTVRTLEEIFASLDQDGTLEGLPFMPEMVSLCGKRLRVKRVANKTCVNGASIFIGRLDDCVVLQTPVRCDGSAHQGCEMGCQFFWKTQWLLPEEAGTSGSGNEYSDSKSDVQSQTSMQWLEEKSLAVPADDGAPRYRCQATELVQIAQPISPFKFKQYVDDHRRDNVSISAIGSFLFSLVIKKLTRKSDSLAGPHEKRTPSGRIGLVIGERVRVKSLAEIRKTLDVNGCNRGLWFDPQEMGQFCGLELVVSRVVTKMIDEKTNKLRIVSQPTVVLSETECSGVFRRFCSRGMLHFWREIWLERVD